MSVWGFLREGIFLERRIVEEGMSLGLVLTLKWKEGVGDGRDLVLGLQSASPSSRSRCGGGGSGEVRKDS